MKKQIFFAILIGVIITFVAGLIIGWMVPINSVALPGERSSLLGIWRGSVDSSTFTLVFFENGSMMFSSYKGNYSINQSNIACRNQGFTLTAEFFFMNNYQTLVLTNIHSTAASQFSIFGMPYGIVMRRA